MHSQTSSLSLRAFLLVCLLSFCSSHGAAQSTNVPARITEAVDEKNLVVLKGNVHQALLAIGCSGYTCGYCPACADVSLTAAAHDPYLLCIRGSCILNAAGQISFAAVSGTSRRLHRRSPASWHWLARGHTCVWAAKLCSVSARRRGESLAVQRLGNHFIAGYQLRFP
jgi:hypothetical protein